MKGKVHPVQLLIIFGLVFLIVYFGITENRDKKEDSVRTFEQAAEEETEPAPEVHDYNVKWEAMFKGYESKITNVLIEGKELRIYFEFFNNSKDTFINGVTWGHAVVNQKQLDANPFGSESVGSEHLSDTKHEGYVVYYADKPEDLENLKDIRLTWTLTRTSGSSMDYDINLPLD